MLRGGYAAKTAAPVATLGGYAAKTAAPVATLGGYAAKTTAPVATLGAKTKPRAGELVRGFAELFAD